MLLLSDCCCFLQEVGHELVLHKVPKTIYGTIVAVSADNPASSSLGGFKEGSTAYRFCRHCLTTREEIKSKVKKNVMILIFMHVHVHLCVLGRGDVCVNKLCNHTSFPI